MSILERLRDPALLGQMGLGEKLWGAVVVMIIGMVACLVALTAIMYAIKLMHLIFKDRKPSPAETPAPAVAAGAVPAPDPRDFTDDSVVVASPCAGEVTALNAQAGAVVRAGDVLLLLKAFNAVNELLAPEDGVVAELRVAQGDKVQSGQIMAVLRGEGA